MAAAWNSSHALASIDNADTVSNKPCMCLPLRTRGLSETRCANIALIRSKRVLIAMWTLCVHEPVATLCKERCANTGQAELEIFEFSTQNTGRRETERVKAGRNVHVVFSVRGIPGNPHCRGAGSVSNDVRLTLHGQSQLHRENTRCLVPLNSIYKLRRANRETKLTRCRNIEMSTDHKV